MKVLHIITSLESGGAERMLSNIVNYDTDNEHIIITLLKAKPHYDLEKHVKMYSLELKNNKINKLKIPILLNRCIKEIKPDIVQTWMKSNYYVPLLKLFNKSVYFVLNIRHGVQKKINKVKAKLIQLYLKHSDGVIFVSNSAIQEFKRAGISFESSRVITNGFKKREFKYTRPKNKKKIRYGYVGRFHEVKNQSLLIDSFNDFAKDKDVTLELAGKGMEYNKFKHLIDSTNKNKFLWRGEVTNSFDVYNNIDILLLTSRSEGFPNVIGEAMSVGVPVITTDAGESYNIIGDAGYKVGSNKISVLEALENTYRNTEELTHKSKLAFQRISENYSISVIVDEYLNYYKKILEE